VAAAHYHFGSKAALVRAVLDRRMTVMAEERLAQLTAIEDDGAPAPRDVAAVFVGPLHDFATTAEGRGYVRFLDALYRAGGDWLAVLDAAFAPQWAQLEPVLSRALPDLDAARRGRRLGLASETQLRMLAYPDRYAGDLDAEAYRDEVIDVFTAIVTGPSQPSHHRQEAP
jgi:AcrR family transcriptional regulator